MRWLEALLFRWPDGHPVDVDALDELGSATALVQVALRVVGSSDGHPRRVDGGVIAEMVAAEVAHLERRGIGPPLIGAVGDFDGIPAEVSRFPGGLRSLRKVVEQQISLRRQRRVPTVVLDPAWTIPIAGEDPLLERVEETLCALADTRFGTRGTLEEERSGADPLVVAAGRYVQGAGEGTEATPTLLAGPLWTSLEVSGEGETGTGRWLDLTAGLLVRDGPRLRSLRFMCLATPGRCVLRAEGPVGGFAAGPDLSVPPSVGRGHVIDVGPSTVAVSEAGGEWVAAAARTEISRSDHLQTVERHVLLEDGSGDPLSTGYAQQLADRLDRTSFEELLRCASSQVSSSPSALIASSAARICSRCSGVARSTARRAHSGSIAARSSMMSRASSMSTPRTSAPRCGCRSINPSVARFRSASRTGVTLTSRSLAMSLCTSRVPGPNDPVTMPRRRTR